MNRSALLVLAVAAAAGLSGCATTSHYYSASSMAPLKVGNARVATGVSVGVTPSGVSVTPRVRYYHPTPPPRKKQ